MRLKAFLAFAIVSITAIIVPAWGQGTTKIGVITSSDWEPGGFWRGA